VAAPPNGSTADGWLCVSTLTAIPWPRASSTIPALSLSDEITQGATETDPMNAESGSSTSTSPRGSTILPLNVLCLQCSDHSCAIVRSSASLGSRPSAAK